MKTPWHLLVPCACALAMAGCREKLGGGFSSIAVGTAPMTYVYGIRSGRQLGFVLFSDIAGHASAGSGWAGSIRPRDGLAVDYAGDPDGLVINGTRHEFTHGRVFLVSTQGGTVSVEQLDVPIGSAPHDRQIESIRRLGAVQDFLKR